MTSYSGVLLMLVVAIVLLFYRWYRIHVTMPLRRLADVAKSLLDGDLAHKQVELPQNDDIRAIARAQSSFRQTLVEQKNAVSRLEHLLRHDHLTGVTNRLFFEESLARVSGGEKSLSLMFIDVDRFKDINDTFGHAGGDATLKKLAELFRQCAGSDAIVSRIGGDEFAILLIESSAAHAEQIGASILRALAAQKQGVLANVGVSIGAASFPENCPQIEALRESADVALYSAKHSGRSRVCSFAAGELMEAQRRTLNRTKLINELDAAIEFGQLRLHYQPKMCSRTNKIDSVEALIRWEHPIHGLMQPNDFILAAEQMGRIERLSEWTLKHAVESHALLADRGAKTRIYVNISGPLLSAPHFMKSLLAIVAGHEEGIGIEITETGVIENPEIALEHLHMLVDAGLKVAIDDYGAGLSSLTYLKQLPAHELKIDRAFISDLSRTHRDPLLVRSTIDLAHALEMKVTAEGVEEIAALALLRVMGCDFVQGYLIAKPMPLEELLVFIQQDRAPDLSFGFVQSALLNG